METSLSRALAALLDPLALLTIAGSLAFLWGLWHLIFDNVHAGGEEGPRS
ncbi:MAG: hypothetical protein KY453_10520 [Gemmatimonadetes bacterium]|nr:hypothetical protein [Gemmatimonadota bacterium]